MFIHHTNAPVEVSVWLGSKTLWNAGAAFLRLSRLWVRGRLVGASRVG